MVVKGTGQSRYINFSMMFIVNHNEYPASFAEAKSSSEEEVPGTRSPYGDPDLCTE